MAFIPDGLSYLPSATKNCTFGKGVLVRYIYPNGDSFHLDNCIFAEESGNIPLQILPEFNTDTGAAGTFYIANNKFSTSAGSVTLSGSFLQKPTLHLKVNHIGSSLTIDETLIVSGASTAIGNFTGTAFTTWTTTFGLYQAANGI